jgi:hypothetical protein
MSLFKVCLILGMLTSIWLWPVHAAEMREALMLQGTACWEKHENIRQMLLKGSGVKAVDAQSVPGYLLVDVVAGMVTSTELSETVNRLYGAETNCRAEPMQSCISPGGDHSVKHDTSKTAVQQ